MEANSSSAQCLGDLSALLEREIIALEDLPDRTDEVRDIIAGTDHGFRPVAIIEVSCSLDRISSIRVVAVGSDSHARTHDPRNPSFFGSLNGPYRPKMGVICRPIVDESRLEVAIDSQYAHGVLDLVCIFGKRILSTYNPEGKVEE